jgi:eukaryotic-like serine/threonine-protein kinase
VAQQPDELESETPPLGIIPRAPVAEQGLPRGAAVGRFLVLDRIGQGGMGTVYSAWDPKLSRRVALKVLAHESDELERARILREARALAQLTHANVVRVYELGEIDDAPFIAMELVEGESLRDVARGTVSEARLLDLYAQAGRGLAVVHSLGIVHRDFKPANVFVGADGRVCIGDFGLAISSSRDDDSSPSKPSGPLDEALTQRGTVVGTVGYMAPEQLRGSSVDARADQFSFAVALWSALYGARPFQSPEATMKGVLVRPRSSTWSGRLLEPVLRRALSTHREARFEDMGALLAAVEQARRRPARVGAVALGALVVAALGWLVVPRAVNADPCGMRARAALAFPSEARTRLSAASKNPLADVGAHVDAYTTQWVTAAQGVCRRDLGPERRSAEECLDRRLADVTALVSVLAAHPEAIDAALPAVLALPPPQMCLHSQRAAGNEAPTGAVRTLERRLSEARAAWLAGRHLEARPLAADVVAAARSMGDLELEAEAQYVVAVSAVDAGDLPGAEAALRAALAGAMQTRSERLEAGAWTELLTLVGDRSRRYDEATRLLPLVRAAVALVPEDLDVLASERMSEALLWHNLGDLRKAAPLAKEGVALTERRVPRDPRMHSRALNIYGNVLAALGDVGGGIRELEAARKALEGALPEGHVSFGSVENNIGLLYQRSGKIEAARRAFFAAAKLFNAAHSPGEGVPLDNLGTLEREEGHQAEARAFYERAHRLFIDSYGPKHERTTNPMLGLALELQAEGEFSEATVLLEQVVRLRVEQNPHSRPALEALLARAELLLESGASAPTVSAAVEAVKGALNENSDLDGIRAELAVLEGVRLLEAGDLPAAQTAFGRAKQQVAAVRWRGFVALVEGWLNVAEGRAASCNGLPSFSPLARRLQRRCAP